MTRTLYEIWPRKGSAPLISFESEADAIAYAAERSIVVPGLRVFEVKTTVAWREINPHTSRDIEDTLDARAFYSRPTVGMVGGFN